MDEIGMSAEDERPDQETTAPSEGVGPDPEPAPWYAPGGGQQAPAPEDQASAPGGWQTPAPGGWHTPAPGGWQTTGAGDWGQPPFPAAPSFPEPPKRRRGVWLAAVVAGLVLLSSGIGIGWSLSRGGHSTSSQTEAPLRTVPQTNAPAGGELTLRQITAKVDPAVVDINAALDQFSNGFNGGLPAARVAGTGMVLTSSGEVLTNNHVIRGATSITVTISGHGTHTASVIGADPVDDVALLQIQGVSGLSTVSLADSSGLRGGQRVVAIGNALGSGGTPNATEGAVVAVGRSINVATDGGGTERLTNLIEADASISQGDSGGALVNRSGQVVGMITAAATRVPGQRESDVGFSIPIDTAVGIVNQIRSGHTSSNIVIGTPGFLGVEVRNLDPSTDGKLGLNVSSGAFVAGVLPDTPASRAGIPANSVITAVDGKPIDSADTLGPAIYVHKPGDQIRVTWVDRNGTHTATVTLIGGPAV